MKQTLSGAMKTRTAVVKPSLAMVAKSDGSPSARPPSSEPSREARIRDAAYALYESRGCSPGHDLDDWLAAEASIDR